MLAEGIGCCVCPLNVFVYIYGEDWRACGYVCMT